MDSWAGRKREYLVLGVLDTFSPLPLFRVCVFRRACGLFVFFHGA